MNPQVFAETFPWLAPMAQFFAAIFLILLMVVFVNAMQGRQWEQQKAALAAWKFEAAYTQEVLLQYPHLSEAEVAEAFELLRQYFRICWQYEKIVAMPSRIVDVCWHTFILDTRAYAKFCEAVYGKFLHHEPPLYPIEPVTTVEPIEQLVERPVDLHLLTMARAYQDALKFEGERFVSNLPNLFSVDVHMKILDGTYYSTEFLHTLADLDLKKVEAEVSKTDGAGAGAGGGLGAACGDGSACGCGGSV